MSSFKWGLYVYTCTRVFIFFLQKIIAKHQFDLYMFLKHTKVKEHVHISDPKTNLEQLINIFILSEIIATCTSKKRANFLVLSFKLY